MNSAVAGDWMRSASTLKQELLLWKCCCFSFLFENSPAFWDSSLVSRKVTKEEGYIWWKREVVIFERRVGLCGGGAHEFFLKPNKKVVPVKKTEPLFWTANGSGLFFFFFVVVVVVVCGEGREGSDLSEATQLSKFHYHFQTKQRWSDKSPRGCRAPWVKPNGAGAYLAPKVPCKLKTLRVFLDFLVLILPGRRWFPSTDAEKQDQTPLNDAQIIFKMGISLESERSRKKKWFFFFFWILACWPENNTKTKLAKKTHWEFLWKQIKKRKNSNQLLSQS